MYSFKTKNYVYGEGEGMSEFSYFYNDEFIILEISVLFPLMIIAPTGIIRWLYELTLNNLTSFFLFCSFLSLFLLHVSNRIIQILLRHDYGLLGYSRIRIAVLVDGRNAEFVFSALQKTFGIESVSVTFTTGHPTATIQLKSFNL